MKIHVVTQGEYMTQIAWRHGVDEAALWEHAKNADLRKSRAHRNILAPGDLVYIPEDAPAPVPLEAESHNAYEAKVPTTEVKVVLVGDDGKPLAGKDFVVEGLPTKLEGTTDGAGTAVFEVPVQTRAVRLRLPSLHRDYLVKVGHLDPHTARDGQLARLSHLGFLSPPLIWRAKKEKLDAVALAVTAFQKAKGLPETGELDDATASALAAEHGS